MVRRGAVREEEGGDGECLLERVLTVGGLEVVLLAPRAPVLAASGERDEDESRRTLEDDAAGSAGPARAEAGLAE